MLHPFTLRCWGLLAAMLLLVEAGPVGAQDSTTTADTTRSWHDTAWTTITERDGLQFAYIFYSEADTENNGLVLRLRNTNDHAVRYDFTILFRGPGREASAPVEGTIEAGAMKTGENDGLFWIPFENGGRIGEVGLRNIDVERVRKGSSDPQFEG